MNALILEEVELFMQCKKCIKRELLSLIGKLLFTCKVVPAGRSFLHRLIDLSMTVKHLHHHIRISRDAQLDLVWWYDFLPSWSGSSLILGTKLDNQLRYETVYRCFWLRRMGCLLVWQMASSSLVTNLSRHAYFMERTIRHCQCCELMGSSMG